MQSCSLARDKDVWKQGIGPAGMADGSVDSQSAASTSENFMCAYPRLTPVRARAAGACLERIWLKVLHASVAWQITPSDTGTATNPERLHAAIQFRWRRTQPIRRDQSTRISSSLSIFRALMAEVAPAFLSKRPGPIQK